MTALDDLDARAKALYESSTTGYAAPKWEEASQEFRDSWRREALKSSKTVVGAPYKITQYHSHVAIVDRRGYAVAEIAFGPDREHGMPDVYRALDHASAWVERLNAPAHETRARQPAGVGDDVTITIPLSEGAGGIRPPRDGWKISRIDRTEYVFLSHSNGSEICLLPGQFALKSEADPFGDLPREDA